MFSDTATTPQCKREEMRGVAFSKIAVDIAATFDGVAGDD